MPSTVTNQNKNTGSVSNQNLGASGATWDEATYTWDNASGTWDNPYLITNQSKNSSSITNQSAS